MTNIFRSIGNAFKAGWNNGNISKGLKAAGMTAMTGALVGAAIDDMKRSRSCCCGGSVFNGYLGGGFCSGNVPYGVQGMSIGIDPYLMQNPMDILGYSNMGYTNNYSSNFGMLNSYMNGGYGANFGMFNNMNYLNPYSYPITQLSSMPEYGIQKAKYTGEKSTAQDPTEAQNMNTALKGMLKDDGKADTSKDPYSFVTDDDKTGTDKEITDKYKARLASIGNAQVKNMDKDSDGFVNLEEYKASTGDTDDTAFNHLDANGDGKLDYREFGAQIATFDASTTNKMKINGQIKAEDYEHWNRAMHDKNDVAFTMKYRENLKNYFDLE